MQLTYIIGLITLSSVFLTHTSAKDSPDIRPPEAQDVVPPPVLKENELKSAVVSVKETSTSTHSIRKNSEPANNEPSPAVKGNISPIPAPELVKTPDIKQDSVNQLKDSAAKDEKHAPEKTDLKSPQASFSIASTPSKPNMESGEKKSYSQIIGKFVSTLIQIPIELLNAFRKVLINLTTIQPTTVVDLGTSATVVSSSGDTVSTFTSTQTQP